MDFSAFDDFALIAVIAGVYGTQASDARLNGAVGALYDRYGRLVFSIAVRVVGDSETAEEITQDVFVRVCEGARTYQPGMSKVSTWLASIARHRAIDELRRRGSRAEKDRSDWPDDIGKDTTEGLELLEGPEATAEADLQQHSLREIIATLPPEQRKVLGLAYFKGLSHSEIASLLGEPLGTVKSRVRMAMHKLREAMAESGITDIE